ncbi:MAG TPA: 50S ribosomal protein L9 [Saprospiraceae bacterium]|nr:50S ribosomal protein L9 [Saprospiraceae bacterium]
MNVILLKNMENLGDKHDVVSVKPGYGRNYLIPQGVAVIANKENVAKLDSIKAEEEAKEAARLDDYKQLAEKLAGQVLKIGVKAGTSGKIFGSVTNVQIVKALREQLGLDIERKKVVLADEIKEVGSYTAKINLHKEVSTNVDFQLIAE